MLGPLSVYGTSNPFVPIQTPLPLHVAAETIVKSFTNVVQALLEVMFEPMINEQVLETVFPTPPNIPE
jgi:hypothetical protein